MRHKNICARTLAEYVGGAYTRGGAYMRDTTVIPYIGRFSLLKDFLVVSNRENYTQIFSTTKYHNSLPDPRGTTSSVKRGPYGQYSLTVQVRLQSWFNCSSGCLPDFMINVAAMNAPSLPYSSTFLHALNFHQRPIV